MVSMDTVIKVLGSNYPILQLLFLNALFSLVPLTFFIIKNHGMQFYLNQNYKFQLIRGIIHSFGFLFVLMGVLKLPLSVVYPVLFSSPLMLLVMSHFFLDENKDLLAKSDYLNFKDVKIPNAFFSGSDPLLKSPRFTEFMVLAEKHILNTTGQYNVGDAFNRLFDYKDEALEWLRDNPLEKYNSKFERKKAFEGFLKDQAKGLNLFQTEVTAEQ